MPSGPGVIKVCRNGIDLLLLETSAMSCMYGSMELM